MTIGENNSAGDEEVNGEVYDQIEYFLENNRKLILKVRSVADIVAKAIQKAQIIKNLKLSSMHNAADDNLLYKDKRKTLARIESQIARAKHKIKNAKNQISLVLGQEKLIELLDSKTHIDSQIKVLETQVSLLKRKLDEVEANKEKDFSKSKIDERVDEIKSQIEAARK